MPDLRTRRGRKDSTAAQSITSTSDYSLSTDDTSPRSPSASRPRSALFSTFGEAMAWLSRTPTTPTTPTRPGSPTHSASTSNGRSPKSPRAKPRLAVGTPPPSPPKARAPGLPMMSPSPKSSGGRDEARKAAAIKTREYEQSLMDPEIYTVGRAKLVNLRAVDGSSASVVRKANAASNGPAPPALQIRPPPKTATPRRSSMKRTTTSHDAVPPSPSFPPSSIAPFNRLVVEQSALPPFEPQLLAGPPPPGSYSKNSLVTLETSSMTLRTTIDTLTSRPSQLAAYILSICPDPPNGPPKVPSEQIHIFLDRPSQPYHIILSYLRLPRSRDNALPALPRAVQLPSHAQTTSMVGVSKLEALLDLRDEARWLGLEELEAMCEAELRTAGLVKPLVGLKQATIAEEVEAEPGKESESDLPPTTASSVASVAPSFSSVREEALKVGSAGRNMPTPPASEDSDNTPSARMKSGSTPPALTVVRPLAVPRTGTTRTAGQPRTPTNANASGKMESRPLPSIPPASAGNTSAAIKQPRAGSAPTPLLPPATILPQTTTIPTSPQPRPALPPASKPVPSASPSPATAAAAAAEEEEEKARRAREKLSEALALRARVRQQSTFTSPPTTISIASCISGASASSTSSSGLVREFGLMTPPRGSIMSARSLSPSPAGRYI